MGRKPAHGSHYIKRILHAGQYKEYYTGDAPHFYHNLLTGKGHVPFAPSGPPLPRRKVVELGIPIDAELDDGGDYLQVCGLTVAMGDSKGVTIATEVHFNMLRAVGLNPEWLTSWEGPDPRNDDVMTSLCIDDVLTEVTRSYGSAPEANPIGKVFMECLFELYAELGIPPKASKVQWGKQKVISLGAELDGVGGRVSKKVVIASITQVKRKAQGPSSQKR